MSESSKDEILDKEDNKPSPDKKNVEKSELTLEEKLKNAEEKLNKKNCDWIISNDIANKNIGFNSDFNEVTIHYKNKKINNEKLFYKKKSEISDEIVDRIIDQLN